MVKVGGNLLLNQVFEAVDIVVLRNFDSEVPLGVVTENKTIEQRKLGGPLLKGLDAIPKRRLSRHTWRPCYNMDIITIQHIGEKCG